MINFQLISSFFSFSNTYLLVLNFTWIMMIFKNSRKNIEFNNQNKLINWVNKYTLLYDCMNVDRIVMVGGEAMSDNFMIFLSTHSTY